MNRGKWSNPEIPLEFLALKLVEEVGEVSKEITDKLVFESDIPHEYVGYDDPNRKRILEELSHVQFLVTVMRKRVEGKKT